MRPPEQARPGEARPGEAPSARARAASPRPTSPRQAPSRALREVRLDEVDREIIRHLQEDGRRPYREIARALEVSEGTIRWRVRRLTDSGVLRIVAVADPFKLGYQMLAFVLISVDPGAHERVIEQLVAWPEVTYVSACTGRYDVYIQVVCRDQDHLFELVSTRIPAIGGVVRTETFPELKMHKVAYYYPARVPLA